MKTKKLSFRVEEQEEKLISILRDKGYNISFLLRGLINSYLDEDGIKTNEN